MCGLIDDESYKRTIKAFWIHVVIVDAEPVRAPCRIGRANTADEVQPDGVWLHRRINPYLDLPDGIVYRQLSDMRGREMDLAVVKYNAVACEDRLRISIQLTLHLQISRQDEHVPRRRVEVRTDVKIRLGRENLRDAARDTCGNGGISHSSRNLVRRDDVNPALDWLIAGARQIQKEVARKHELGVVTDRVVETKVAGADIHRQDILR